MATIVKKAMASPFRSGDCAELEASHKFTAPGSYPPPARPKLG